jgi:protein arginine kinase activator
VTKTPLGSFLAAMGKESEAPVPRSADSCARCGGSLQDFRESGRLGCPECWRTVEAPLRDLLRRLHGSTPHVGERYADGQVVPAGPKVEVAALREQLRAAVASENFELAAELRDRLRVLE